MDSERRILVPCRITPQTLKEKNMGDYHEPTEKLDGGTQDCVRALHSLREEIEAINWYHQRVAATGEQSLAKILAHNRDEEMEHAAMALEWLRRNMEGWDEVLRTYLFTEEEITEIEEDEGEAKGEESLGIGKIKENG
jgi:hypothetical protein